MTDLDDWPVVEHELFVTALWLQRRYWIQGADFVDQYRQ
jgi:hypothetical protein